MLSGLRRVAHIALFSILAYSASAQDTNRHSIEISGVGRQTANQVTYIYGPPTGPIRVYHEQIFGGGVVGYSFALSPTFALEARAGYLFGHQPQVTQDGGEQIPAHVGLRATAPLGHSRYAFRARVAPGIASFSSGLRSQDITLVPLVSGVSTYVAVPHYGRITHFSLEEGVGVSARLLPGTFLNFDVSNELIVSRERRQIVPLEGNQVVEGATLEGHAVVTVGISHSFGHAFPALPRLASRGESASPPPNELVLSYALQPTLNLDSYDQGLDDLGFDSGFAITGSHYLRPWLALDSSVVLLHGTGPATFQDGGSQLQFFGGIKVGTHRSRYGIFGKIRPGLVSFDNAYVNSYGVPPPRGASAHFGGDLGAVLELYPARHLVMRLDLGETLIHYSAVKPLSNYGTNYVPAISVGDPQFLLGTGWRF